MATERDLVSRLEAAVTVGQVLGAAYDAFELMLVVIRRHDQPDGPYFLRMVTAGAPAGDGRDCLLFAPSLAACRPGPPGRAGPPAASQSADEALHWLDAVSRALADRLDTIAGQGMLAGDQAACRRAAACAREITEVVSRGGS